MEASFQLENRDSQNLLFALLLGGIISVLCWYLLSFRCNSVVCNVALIFCSVLSVCCETRETDELVSQGAVELQRTAVCLSGLFSHPFDHAASKACRDQKTTLYTPPSPGREQFNLVRDTGSRREKVFREKQFLAFYWWNKVLSDLKGVDGTVTQNCSSKSCYGHCGLY